ncbi:MAG: acetylglutamate kinase [Deltaproteobacteria bacterium]|nr:acetylglutamate kinase [Deltaproteobacteria bacterium]
MAVAEKVVIKVGGEVLAGDQVRALAGDVRVLSLSARVVLVHGGGPQATDLQKRLGIEPVQVGGRRITDAATLDVMKMVLAGKLNVDFCAALVENEVKPVGLHGASGLVVQARKRPPRVVTGGGPDPVDFGHVGDVVGFNLGLLEILWAAGYVPVIACLGADDKGGIYNINADVVANQLAATLKADHLFLVTSTPGVLRDLQDPSSRLPSLSVGDARRAIASGAVTGGMIPKLEEAISVLDQGVGAIHILGKLASGDLLRASQEPGAVGTTLRRDLGDRDHG